MGPGKVLSALHGEKICFLELERSFEAAPTCPLLRSMFECKGCSFSMHKGPRNLKSVLIGDRIT